MIGKTKKQKSIVGLDIDEKSVKLVELKKSPLGIALVNYAIKEVETDASSDRNSSISNTIKKAVRELGIEDAEVFSSVSGPGVSIRRITVPEMPEGELRGAVRWEAKNLIPFPIENAVIDHYVIGKTVEKGIDKLDIIVVAAQQDVLNQTKKIIEAAGLRLSGITVNSFALWDVVKRSVDAAESEVTALIDIGAETASINLFKGSVLQFTREISVAGESITKSMTGMLISDQWQLSLTYEQAEKIKNQYGIPGEGTAEKTAEQIPLAQVLEAIKPTLRRMLNEILRSFDYYKEQFREPKIDKVFLGGGSSKLKGLEDFLSSGLSVRTEVLNPLRNINIDLKLNREIDKLIGASPRLTLALGLAMGETRTLNLIQGKKPEAKAIDIDKVLQGIRVPSTALIAGALIVLLAAFGYNYYLSRQVRHFTKELDGKRVILNDLRQLADRRAIIERISKEETRIRETLSSLGTTIPPGISLFNLSYMNASKKMDLRGEALNQTLVGRFLKNLKDSPYFSNVALIETKRSVEGSDKVMFSIALNVN